MATPPAEHAADRLLAAIDEKRAPVCVGLDPMMDRLPSSLRPSDHDSDSSCGAIQLFCGEVLRAVAPLVPCVKFQSACFERFGEAGIRTLKSSIQESKQLGLQVILDAKRGDIAATAEHYAAAAFDDMKADWLTINSYFGEDGIRPFLRSGHGVFALVRTSNPSADRIQSKTLSNGSTVADTIAQLIAEIGRTCVGARGFSALGSVVAATKSDDAKRLRSIMPQQMFLVPGYGAQGGGIDDILPCFRPDGSGAIITASRSVIYAFDSEDSKWVDGVADAAAKFADEIGRAVGLRS